MKYTCLVNYVYSGNVTSFAEVWIEIEYELKKMTIKFVTSFAEVWIEISATSVPVPRAEQSLPSRKCGLKSKTETQKQGSDAVTSFAEVWIEIDRYVEKEVNLQPSLPSRKCGLKFPCTANL